jgi:hypothetical protein
MKRRICLCVLVIAMAAMVVPVSGCGRISSMLGLGRQEVAPEPVPEPATEPAMEPGTDAEPADAADATFAVGDSVAAIWDDGSYYLANVIGVKGDQITVRYVDDASTKTVPSSDVRPVPVKAWAAGDRVLAVWSMGRFYPGTIIEANDPTYKVKWDDGSEPTDVVSDRIIAAE